MVSIFSAYIKNISMCIIFSAFVEMMLPNNNFKKYINLVLGFITIIAILNPLKNFLFKTETVDFKVFSMSSQIENNSLLSQKDIYENNQKNLIISTYKQQLKEQITKLVSEKENLNIEDIYIEVNEDFESDKFSQIKQIKLYAQNEVTNTDYTDKQINIAPVEKVTIGQKSIDVYFEESDRDTELEKNLETLISDFYKLNKDNIYIIVHRK